MGKITQILIEDFSGGMSEDKRVKIANKYSLTRHFDALTFPHKLVPYYKTEAIEDKTLSITDFVYAPRSTTEFRLFGHGATAGNSSIFMLDIDAGGTSWDAARAGTGNDSTLTKTTGCFFYFKDYIYMWAGGTKVIRFKSYGDEDLDDNYKSIAYTTIAQPVHHPADDTAYFFADNLVYKQSVAGAAGGASLTLALTLPSNLKIVSACAHGNYLAIGCVTKGTSDAQSVVFLWDRDSSLATLSERIDFGSGSLVHLASLDNQLIAVIDFFISNVKVSLSRGKVVIKRASGATAETLNELFTDSYTVSVVSTYKVVKNNKLYFSANIPLNNDPRNGIWVVNSNGKMGLDIIEEEVDTAASTYQGIYATGNMWWIAHSSDGSVNRLDNNEAYSTTLASVYESLIFDVGDRHALKKLLGVSVSTEALPTAGQIVIKYRKDADLKAGSWTTIYTNTTDNSIQHGAINIESSGANLPEFKELQIRVESTGGAVITGLKIKAEVINDDIIQIR